MHHIVFYSSGISSLFVARFLAAKGVDILLVFADTKLEHPSNYRFLEQSIKQLGCKCTKLQDGRNIFELWHDKRAIANNRMPFCSIELKSKVCKKYITDNYQPSDCILYFGISSDEEKRTAKIKANWHPYQCDFPLLNLDIPKSAMIKLAESEGLEMPLMYKLGFNHANCSGACVRAGKKQWLELLEKLPEVYQQWENEEEKMRNYLGKNVAILKQTVNGIVQPLTLKDLRELHEQKVKLPLFDDSISFCDCFN